MKLFYHIFYEISPVFLIFQFHLDNCMNLYYNCIKMINTVKTHHTVHTENMEGLYDHTGLSGPASDL